MPIKPENVALYPPAREWERIRLAILERAGHACEECRVPNYALGYRDAAKEFHPLADGKSPPAGMKLLRIVLTIAHLDHNPKNNDPANLRAWCQRHHIAYDARHHAENARRTRQAKRGQSDLPV